MLSFNVSTVNGQNMLGREPIFEFIESLEAKTIYSVGINFCVADIPAMSPLVQKLSRYGTRVSLYPNAGMPDGNGRYNKTPGATVCPTFWPLLENKFV